MTLKNHRDIIEQYCVTGFQFENISQKDIDIRERLIERPGLGDENKR